MQCDGLHTRLLGFSSRPWLAWMRWASQSFSSDEDEDEESILHNELPESCSGKSINNRVVFGFKNSTRLLIGSGSCWIRLRNRVDRVDTNLTREPELSSLLLYIPPLRRRLP